VRSDAGVAFLFLKNSDPTLTGQWLAAGDQTGEGWTVVKVGKSFVNVVSPEGRVVQIQSGP